MWVFAVSSSETLTFLASIVGSSLTAGVIVALMSRTTERKRQLREQMLDASGAFASGAMEALACIRHYKPTKELGGPLPHPNTELIVDFELRDERFNAANEAIDRLRPLRGKVHLVFAAASGSEDEVLWHTESIARQLRAMLEASRDFWSLCDAEPERRIDHEAWADGRYTSARDATKSALDGFCRSAGQLTRSP